MKDIPHGNIFTTGRKFVVTDETVDGVFGPGTTGMMSYIKGVDTTCPNVLYLYDNINPNFQFQRYGFIHNNVRQKTKTLCIYR